MDKAYLSLKHKGVNIKEAADAISRSTKKNTEKHTPNKSGTGTADSQRRRIEDQVKLYSDISSTFHMLHGNQVRMNAETTSRPSSQYANSRISMQANKMKSFFQGRDTMGARAASVMVSDATKND